MMKCFTGSLVFFPLAASIISFLIGKKDKKLRDGFVKLVCIAEFLLAAGLFAGYTSGNGGMDLNLPGICGMGLSFTTDGFRSIYAVIAAFMWMITSLLSEEYFAHYRNRNRYYLFYLVTLGATEAVFLSADLFTTFVFFEIMSFASYVWVAQDEREASLRAALTYLAVAVIGGMVMLMGLFLLYTQCGTLMIFELRQACAGKDVTVAAVCLLFGFGAKAGAFPLHIWLPKAHPVAPAPASALLSGILTKTGIFGILVITCYMMFHDRIWGTFVLILGVLTMVVGAVLALFSCDFKRTLACSSVSQIGFILVGAGMQGLLGEENLLAVRGTFLHMVNHSLFKLVLFSVAGVIFMNIHKLDLNEIRGFGRKKPWLAGIYLMGALGIGGIPLWSGYISKTLIHESIVEYIHLIGEDISHIAVFGVIDMKIIEWLFLFSGGLTVAYMCKLFVAVFLEENQDQALQASYDANTSYIGITGKTALTVAAVLFPLFGMMPHLSMDRLADLAQSFMGAEGEAHRIAYFSLANLKGGLISIGIGLAIYLIVVRRWMMKKALDGRKGYINKWPKILDLEDYLYRPVLLRILPAIGGGICYVLDHFMDTIAKILPIAGSVQAGFFDTVTDGVIVFLRKTIYKESPVQYELEEGNEVTAFLGRMMNRIVFLLNHTIWRKHPNTTDYVHRFALTFAAFKENSAIIGRSLSYGLILFCLGFCATLIYLLISAFS